MIRITSGNIIFDVETESELKMVMNVLAKGTKGIVQESLQPASKGSFIKLNQGLSPNARKVIQSLRDKPDGLTLDDFKEMGLSGSVLGGTLGGITKMAKRLGISGEDVIRSDYSVTPEKYYLGMKMREAIEGK